MNALEQEAYKKGLNEAWDCAKELVTLMLKVNYFSGYYNCDLTQDYTCDLVYQIFANNDVHQALEKLEFLQGKSTHNIVDDYFNYF